MTQLTRGQSRQRAEIQYQREMNDKEGGLAPELHQKEEWVHWKVVEIERRGAEPWEIALLDRRHGLIARICATARRMSLQLRGIRG